VASALSRSLMTEKLAVLFARDDQYMEESGDEGDIGSDPLSAARSATSGESRASGAKFSIDIAPAATFDGWANRAKQFSARKKSVGWVSDRALNLRPARAVRAIQDIADQIRDELKAGRLRPGQRLPPERELAKQLGVGRNTVREAMSMLEVSGLIDRKTGSAGGAFITASTAAAVSDRIADGIMLGDFTIDQLIEARLALETFIARLACERGSDADFDALETLIDQTERIPLQDWDARLIAYRAIFDAFTSCAHNPLLHQLINPLLENTRELVRRLGPPKNDQFLKHRRKLVAAFRARNREQAAEIIVETIDYVSRVWTSRL
jgi:GntR family transcriptional repressor for pyruvate dehydrogenase complex